LSDSEALLQAVRYWSEVNRQKPETTDFRSFTWWWICTVRKS